MSSKSDYLENLIINWVRGTAMPTAPTNVFVALFNGSPTDAGTGGTEVTTTIRAAGRLAATFGAPSPAGQSANSAAVAFGNAAGAARVSHVAIFDAATGGNLLYHAAVTNPLDITAGIPVSFPVGNLRLTED